MWTILITAILVVVVLIGFIITYLFVRYRRSKKNEGKEADPKKSPGGKDGVILITTISDKSHIKWNAGRVLSGISGVLIPVFILVLLILLGLGAISVDWHHPLLKFF